MALGLLPAAKVEHRRGADHVGGYRGARAGRSSERPVAPWCVADVIDRRFDPDVPTEHVGEERLGGNGSAGRGSNRGGGIPADDEVIIELGIVAHPETAAR